MKTEYKLPMQILSVTELKEKFDWKKDDKGQTTFRERSLGWFIRFTNSSAIGPFDDKPEYNPGDWVTMVIR